MSNFILILIKAISMKMSIFVLILARTISVMGIITGIIECSKSWRNDDGKLHKFSLRLLIISVVLTCVSFFVFH